MPRFGFCERASAESFNSAMSPRRAPTSRPSFVFGKLFLTVADVSVLPGLMLWSYRHPKFVVPVFFVGIPVWIVASFILHGDDLKNCGVRLDNLGVSTRCVLPLAMVLYVGLLSAALIDGSVRKPYLDKTWLDPGLYFTFCLVQQVFLNSFLNNRLLSLIPHPPFAAVAAGGIFAALHWPNHFLMGLTFFGGAVMAFFFARNRNILPLAICHWGFVMVMLWAVPPSYHHDLMVGPAYLSSQRCGAE